MLVQRDCATCRRRLVNLTTRRSGLKFTRLSSTGQLVAVFDCVEACALDVFALFSGSVRLFKVHVLKIHVNPGISLNTILQSSTFIFRVHPIQRVCLTIKYVSNPNPALLEVVAGDVLS